MQICCGSFHSPIVKIHKGTSKNCAEAHLKEVLNVRAEGAEQGSLQSVDNPAQRAQAGDVCPQPPQLVDHEVCGRGGIC